MPGLDRLAVREISARYLSQEERIEIADLRHAGLSIRQIAEQLGRAPSTISRELRRNATAGGYGPFEAHRRATVRRARHHRRRVETSEQLRHLVAELLAQRWSPEQISRQLRLRFPGQPAMWLCHESIYQAIYQPGSPLMRPSRWHRTAGRRCAADVITAARTSCRAAPAPVRAAHAHHPPAALRPARQVPGGHWEGDLIIGKDQGSAIGTLVERQTRMVRLLHMPCRDSDTLHEALKARLAGLPPPLLRSITWDQGTEMARHLTITRSLGALVYFCDSHSPWQRGSNENMNGLLRDYFPKGTDLSAHTPRSSARCRERAQQPAQASPRRPDPGQTLRRAASLRKSVCVAHLRQRPEAVVGSLSDSTCVGSRSWLLMTPSGGEESPYVQEDQR